MGREVRRRGRRRAAAAKEKNKNWFMKLKMWQRVLLCTVGVLICTFSAAAIYVAAKWGKIQTQDIEAKDLIINEEVQEKNGEINLGKGYTNIALFGVDSRDGNLGKGNRTDCIIVASLNNETKEVKMISVYRDTLLDLSDGTLQKCNAAYSYGGPTQAVNMLNLNLDLDIQKYVTVDFGAIADAIDLLGGDQRGRDPVSQQVCSGNCRLCRKRGTPGRNCRTSVIRRSSGNDLCKNPVDSRW